MGFACSNFAKKNKRLLAVEQAILPVVTQRFSPGALREDTDNGTRGADYVASNLTDQTVRERGGTSRREGPEDEVD